MPHDSEYHRRLQHARHPRQHRAKPRRRQPTRARLQREQARAQHHLQALERALVDWGLPETLVVEVEWRLKALGRLLGNICGSMLPTRFGCRTADELTRGRGGDQNLPGKVRGALPKQTWVRQLPPRGQDLLATLGHRVEDKSPATRSRGPWSWGGDESVFKKSGQPLGLVGAW